MGRSGLAAFQASACLTMNCPWRSTKTHSDRSVGVWATVAGVRATLARSMAPMAAAMARLDRSISPPPMGRALRRVRAPASGPPIATRSSGGSALLPSSLQTVKMSAVTDWAGSVA